MVCWRGGKELRIINLTSHNLNLFDEDGNQILTVRPSGTEARIKVVHRLIDRADGIPFFVTEPAGPPTGLPGPQENTIYVVSGMFRSFCDRPDLYQPGQLVRDDEDRPIGCIGLSR